MTGLAIGAAPQSDVQWARQVEQRLSTLESPKTQRVGTFVLTDDNAGNLFAHLPTAVAMPLVGPAAAAALTTAVAAILQGSVGNTFLASTAGPADTGSGWNIGDLWTDLVNYLAQIGGMTVSDITSFLVSWENVLAGLGAMAVSDITSLLTSWADLLTGLGAMTTSNITALLTSWAELFTGLGAFTTAQVTAMLVSWSNMFTALGAFTTGEVTSMLVSWSNLYTALGAFTSTEIGDLMTSWSDVVTGLGAFTSTEIGDLMTSWSNVLTGLGAMTTGNITSLLTSWSDMLTGLGAMTTSNITSLVTSWSDMLTGLGAMTTGNITSLLTSWSNTLTSLGAMSTANITALLTSWSDVLTGLGSMTTGNITSLLTSWSDVITGLGAMATSDVTNALTSWSHVISGLGAMATSDITNVFTSWSDVVTGLGAFTTGEITSLMTSWTNVTTGLGSLPNTLITNVLGGSSLGADVQALVTDFTNVFGGATTTLTGLISQLDSVFGSAFPGTFVGGTYTFPTNTPGVFTPFSQFQQLVDGIVNNGTQNNTVAAGVAAFHNWILAAQSAISQAVLDGLNAVNQATGIAKALQNISNELITDALGGSSLGQDVSNIESDIANAISGAASGATSIYNNVTSLMTELFNGFTSSGATAASSTNVGSATQNAASTISTNSVNISATAAQINALITGGPSSGIADTVNFSDYANATTLSAAGFTGITMTGAGGVGISGGSTLWETSGIPLNSSQFNYYGTATSTDYQTITAVLSALNSYQVTEFSLVGRSNNVNPNTSGTCVYAEFGGGTLSLVAVVSGSATTLGPGVNYTPVNSTLYQLVCGTSASVYEYQVYANGTLLLDYTDSSHVSQHGSGFRGSGFIESAEFSAGVTYLPPNLSSWGIADGAAGLPSPLLGLWCGSPTQYSALGTYNSQTLYFVT